MASAQHVDDSFAVNHLMSTDTTCHIQSYKVYRTLALMEINRALFKIICYVGHNGPYEFRDGESDTKTVLKLKAIHRSCRVDIFYVGNSKGTVYVMKYLPCYKTCDQCLSAVQRHARRWRDKRRSERALPVAMALHRRLGAAARIAVLQEDIVRLVCAYI
jgi:hypothetical protein